MNISRERVNESIHSKMRADWEDVRRERFFYRGSIGTTDDDKNEDAEAGEKEELQTMRMDDDDDANNYKSYDGDADSFKLEEEADVFDVGDAINPIMNWMDQNNQSVLNNFVARASTSGRSGMHTSRMPSSAATATAMAPAMIVSDVETSTDLLSSSSRSNATTSTFASSAAASAAGGLSSISTASTPTSMTINKYIQQHSFLERGHDEPRHSRPFPFGHPQQRQRSTTSYCSDSVNNYDVAECHLDSFEVGSTTSNDESDSEDGHSYNDTENYGASASASASDADAYMQQQYQRQQQQQQTQKEDPYRMASFQTSRRAGDIASDADADAYMQQQYQRQQQQQQTQKEDQYRMPSLQTIQPQYTSTPIYATTATTATGLMNPTTASGVTGSAASFAPSFFRGDTATPANGHPHHQYQQQQQQQQPCFITQQQQQQQASWMFARGATSASSSTSLSSCFVPAPAVTTIDTTTPYRRHRAKRVRSVSSFTLPSSFVSATTVRSGSGGESSVMSNTPTIVDTTTTTTTTTQHRCASREKSASTSSLPTCFAATTTTERIDSRAPRVKSASSPSTLPSCFDGPAVPVQRRQGECMIGRSTSNTIDIIPQNCPQQRYTPQQQQFEHGVTTVDYGSFIPNETTFDDIWEE